MDRFVTGIEHDMVEKDGGNMQEPSEKEARDKTYMDIGRFFFENGIAFNVVKSPSFINMCRSIGNFGHGLKPPTPYELSTTILNAEEENTKAIVADVKKTWTQTRVSIMSDGWKDMRGRQLINFLVNNPHGTVFLKSIDASNVSNFIYNYGWVLALMRSYTKKQTIKDGEDPLVCEDVPSDDEWMVEQDVVGETSTNVDMSEPSESLQVGEKKRRNTSK
ncbi:hypothetical protein LWI29_002651 [Acer saccharum]|uniref:DUF659 domain-containing protein n=1 Tax=Acer saccharum TaxID=4024 RepID=A0AA39TCY2_ACESA|nr:hypothetical protein LWI29_002651 [Acer saccharum]